MQSAILSADAKIYCISFNIDNLYKGSWIGKLFLETKFRPGGRGICNKVLPQTHGH